MADSAKVTISFESTHPMAMMLDWTQQLGLLDTRRMRELGISSIEIDVQPSDSSPE